MHTYKLLNRIYFIAHFINCNIQFVKRCTIGGLIADNNFFKTTFGWTVEKILLFCVCP